MKIYNVLLSTSMLDGMNALVIASFAHEFEARKALEKEAKRIYNEYRDEDSDLLRNGDIYSFDGYDGVFRDIYIQESEIKDYFPCIVMTPDDFDGYDTSSMSPEELTEASERVSNLFSKVDSSWEVFWECVRIVAEEELGLEKKKD